MHLRAIKTAYFLFLLKIAKNAKCLRNHAAPRPGMCNLFYWRAKCEILDFAAGRINFCKLMQDDYFTKKAVVKSRNRFKAFSSHVFNRIQ